MSDYSAAERDYSVFDNDIEGKRFDFQLLRRLFSWLKPYRTRALLAVACVLLAATATVLAPVIVTRVVIDGLLLPGEGMEAPDMGQTELVSWFANLASLDVLVAACVIYGGWVRVQIDSVIEELFFTSYHVYIQSGIYVLKPTYWYKMTAKKLSMLEPQIEEGIEHVEWVKKENVLNLFANNTYRGIFDLLNRIYL